VAEILFFQLSAVIESNVPQPMLAVTSDGRGGGL